MHEENNFMTKIMHQIIYTINIHSGYYTALIMNSFPEPTACTWKWNHCLK